MTIIQGDLRINGSILVEENATIVLRDAALNFIQGRDYEFEIRLENPSGGGPRLLVENATILGNEHSLRLDMYASASGSVNMLSAPDLHLYTRGSSTLNMSASSIRHLGCVDRSNVHVSDSSLRSAEVREYSTCQMLDCTMERLQAYTPESMDLVDSTVTSHLSICALGANLSADRLLPGFYSSWSLRGNCSILVAPGGRASKLSLTDTQVEGWNLEAFSSSNVTVSNSDLRIIYLGDTARLVLENTTLEYCNTKGQAQATVAWPLEIRVLDSIGQGIPSADVEAASPDGGPAQSGVTGPDGWTRLTLEEKLLNATGEYLAGIYTIKAGYGGYSATTAVNMTETENRRIEMVLSGFPVPESGSLPALGLTLVLALIIAQAHHHVRIKEGPQGNGRASSPPPCRTFPVSSRTSSLPNPRTAFSSRMLSSLRRRSSLSIFVNRMALSTAVTRNSSAGFRLTSLRTFSGMTICPFVESLETAPRASVR